MSLSSPVKAAAFNPQEKMPPNLSAARMLVNVERLCWVDENGVRMSGKPSATPVTTLSACIK